jgi:gas vesicle protein
MFDVIKNVVGAVAPTLGTALGGPLGGAAASMIADALGCENNPKAIEKAVQHATPADLAKIKESELRNNGER